MKDSEISSEDRENFDKLLNQIESIIIGKLDTPFDAQQIRELNVHAKQIWQTGLEIQFNSALTDLKLHLQQLTEQNNDASDSFDSTFELLKEEIHEDMFGMLTYDRIDTMSPKNFNYEAELYLQSIINLVDSEKQLIQKLEKSQTSSESLKNAKLKHAFYLRYAESLQAGIYAFNRVSKELESKKPDSRLGTISKSIFPAVGAFIGAICGVLSAPIVVASYAISGGLIVGMGAAFDIEVATFNKITESKLIGTLLSAVGFIAFAPLGMFLGTAIALRNLIYLNQESNNLDSAVVYGAQIGRELGKRYFNQEHALRATLLNSIYTLRANNKPKIALDSRASILINLGNAINSFLHYIKIASEQEFTKKKLSKNNESIVAVTKEITDISDIVQSIRTYLNLELEQLRNCYTDAVNDNNIKALSEIYLRIEELERDWKPIDQSWQIIKTGTNKNDSIVDKFCQASTACLERLKSIHEVSINKSKTNYDFGKERKTKIWSDYYDNNSASKDNNQLDEILDKILRIRTTNSSSKS